MKKNRSITRIIVLAICFSLLLGCTVPPQATSTPTINSVAILQQTQPITMPDFISVNPNIQGQPIPTDFVGLSIEKGDLCIIDTLQKQTPIMAKLFANLSPAVLRIGGGSVESTKWEPYNPGCSATIITQKLVEDTFSFVKKINWKIIWGIKLKDNSPAAASDEAKYVVSKAGSSLLALELGNEPNSYFADYLSYKTQWEELAIPIIAELPGAPILGPSTLGDRFAKNFLDDEHNRIKLASFHYYPLGCNNASDPLNISDKMARMLDPTQLNNDLSTTFDPIVSQSARYSLHIRLDETNNICEGGTRGVSDTFASSLWATDYLFTLLEHGIKGINFHGHPDDDLQIDNLGQYSPVSWSNGSGVPFARPEYYALLLFLYAARNGHVVPILNDTQHIVAAHAVVNTDQKLQVILVNENTFTAAVHINTTNAYGSATVIRLTAPSLTTTISTPAGSRVNLGGSPVAADGTWGPGTPENIAVNGNLSTVSVPPASAAVITYTP